MVARMRSESAQRVSGCVTALLREQPFFGSLALRLPVRADAGRETLASDGREIRYSPQWIAKTDAHLIETAIARVVLACALKHHTRRGDRDPERWQRASQLVTHGLLRDAGFTLPPDAEAWDGISVEEAYDRLPEPEPDDDGSEDNSDPPAGAGGSGADGAGAPMPDGSDPSGDRDGGDAGGSTEASNDDGHEDRPGDPRDGGNAPASCDPSGTGEVMDAPAGSAGEGDGSALSPGAITVEEQAWDEAMHQALSLAKAEGKLPGGIEETVRCAHAGTLDWRSLLRRYMTDAVKSDYSWSVPNRRFIDSGLYLPSIRSDGIDAIAVIIDTSGSLPTETLAAFWAELREVAAEIRPERVVVLQVDAAVQAAAEYAPDELPGEIVVKGRRGTDFRPGFAWLDEQGVRPGVCLYFTDMECSRFPEAEPSFPVLWCDHGDSDSPWRHPEPWGERIDIATARSAAP